jgi:SAM-dependent methyltransferase
MKCRACGADRFGLILDLGFTPPADGFLSAAQLDAPEATFPLRLCRCVECGFLQLDHVVSPELLYQSDYPYESSITQTGLIHWRGMAERIVTRFGLGEKDLAVDIGSNVGVLLRAFQERGLRVQGVDPAPNIVEIAVKGGIDTECAFFGRDAVEKILSAKGKARVVTGTNVFAHVDDLNSLVDAVQALLTDDGVFVIEAPHACTLLEHLEYDTIYHEHLSYISLTPLVPFFARHNMSIIDVEQQKIHGGSLRIYVGKGKHAPSANVSALLERESVALAPDGELLTTFASRVEANRQSLSWLLHSLKHEGKRLVGVSAPAKGMTLLNYCGIGRNLLDFVTEKSTLKVGRFTPGGHIPVVPDAALMEQRPDYALLLAWNFADEIMKNLESYRQAGGRFIVPIPEPRIVS